MLKPISKVPKKSLWYAAGREKQESKSLMTIWLSVFYFRAVLMEITRRFRYHSHSYLVHPQITPKMLFK